MSLERVTTVPDGPADPFKETVPVELPPAKTVVGLRVTAEQLAGLMVNVADLETPPPDTVIVALTVESTPCVVTVNVPEVCPGAIATTPGVCAAELLLVI